MTLWKCTSCRAVLDDEDRPKRCPVCKRPTGFEEVNL